MDNTQFILILIGKVPWTRNLYEEHLKYNDEILPHILMEELSEVFVKMSDELFVLGENGEVSLSCLTQFLLEIENGMLFGTDEVNNVIALSFLENINPFIKSFQFIKDLMGESSKAELESLIALQYG